MKNCSLSFLARIRQQLFRHRLDFEIFHRIFPHLQKEATAGYSFQTNEEITAATEEIDLHALIDQVERQAQSLPVGYGRALRYVMHRDLQERLVRYGAVTQWHLPHRLRDPRFAPACV